jgi:hypothetical protein
MDIEAINDRLGSVGTYAFKPMLRPVMSFGQLSIQDNEVCFISRDGKETIRLPIQKLAYKVRSNGNIVSLTYDNVKLNIFFSNGDSSDMVGDVRNYESLLSIFFWPRFPQLQMNAEAIMLNKQSIQYLIQALKSLQNNNSGSNFVY